MAAVFLAVLAGSALPDAPHRNSEFVFARVQFTEREFRTHWWEEPWHHDYPASDEFLLTMLKELTVVHVQTDAYKIVPLSSPEIFQYPFLYVSEPGFMDLTDQEVANLGKYLRRGGFIMADDFRTASYLGDGIEELAVLRYYLKRAVPEWDLVPLTVTHPIFSSFFKIDTLNMPPPYGSFVPQFWGLSDNHGTLRVIANYNNDLGEFWEWVDKGEMPFHFASESTKLAVNYVIYAMTH